MANQLETARLDIKSSQFATLAVFTRNYALAPTPVSIAATAGAPSTKNRESEAKHTFITVLT
jgi:hypothetical protein